MALRAVIPYTALAAYSVGSALAIGIGRLGFGEDAFDVEFEDGLCFLESHAPIRKANGISARAMPVCVEVDEELGSHFKVTYDTGDVAEVSWAFVRELAPKR